MKNHKIDTKHVSQAAVSHFHSSTKPEKIADFWVDALLQRGNTYECYRVFDAKKSKTLFLKIVNPSWGSLPSSLVNLRREAEILSRLSHPLLAKYADHGLYDGRLGVLTEYYDSISLRSFLHEENPTIDEAFFILDQLAQVVNYLHQNSVIHSDLKPENILVLPTGDIRLVDFGIAQLVDELVDTKVQRLAGTLLYMSPEQHKHEGKLSFSSDLYSLAIIAFELVTGRLSHGVVKLSALPTALQKTFAKALHLNPSQRYDSAFSFLDALKAHKHILASKISAQIRPITLAKNLIAKDLHHTHSSINRDKTTTLSFTTPPYFWPLNALWISAQSKSNNSSTTYALLIESADKSPESYIALHQELSFLRYMLQQFAENQISHGDLFNHLLEKSALLSKPSVRSTPLLEGNTLENTQDGSAFFLEISEHWQTATLYPLSGQMQIFTRSEGSSDISHDTLKRTSALSDGKNEQETQSFIFDLQKIEAAWIFTSCASLTASNILWMRLALTQAKNITTDDFTLRLAREASEQASKDPALQATAPMQRIPRKVGICRIFRNI